jgi:Short C-terminal domain/Phospholipase_D-nuclease N-terminal
MPLATFTFAEALLEALELALLFIWIWIAIGVVLDIFRSHDLSGWGKAAWMLLIIILPFLGVLIYLIVRGHNMHERTANAARHQDDAFRAYVRDAASTPADDIAKLADLKDRGVLSEEEFQAAKAKALSNA